MGTVYAGAYAELIGADHEGYAARRLPDGSLTSTWTAQAADFTGYVAACSCGWHGSVDHPPTDDGEIAAAGEWHQTHLQELIAKAEAGWPSWAECVAVRARVVAGHVASGRPDMAAEIAARLEGEVATWRRTAQELAQEAAQSLTRGGV
ncbi:hypothetical protein SAMN05421678_106271 [Actinopolymorpha cephalotaxi]|uniref:Uncharacterized protein n=1 Tax=Actinopolymorpha cephalotaxi TaxID=504797 RepID=A0A1I2SLL0_9ACTN|nr:hypothetical protein [Actinopolymorpha cephalotaxi]NYH84020.1 hypothetical protein [Actinopolymorpha cephalotaxi]SFG53612.1 hypothetical protein SAMN05421678_106271 [Actinopolymorpha cephalotaxi]